MAEEKLYCVLEMGGSNVGDAIRFHKIMTKQQFIETIAKHIEYIHPTDTDVNKRKEREQKANNIFNELTF